VIVVLIVAVDAGTTSIRAWTVADGDVRAEQRGRGGAKDVAGGRDPRWLAERVRSLADRTLEASGTPWTQVDAVVAFGMVTSEFGLEEVAHLPAPANAEDLAAGLRRHVPAVEVPAPVMLVPGVVSRTADVASADFMRGEETQIVGLLAAGRVEPPLLYVSAGSHTKFVTVTADGAISGSFTTLSGELLWALSRETILAPLLDLSLPLSDPGAADEGARLVAAGGLSRALYAVRVLNRLDGAPSERCTDIARGAIAAADIAALSSLGSPPSTVVLASGGNLAAFYARVLECAPWVDRVVQTDDPLGAIGAWDLYMRAVRR
jgi:2-dehydro-3-deoxygalactonokinase